MSQLWGSATFTEMVQAVPSNTTTYGAPVNQVAPPQAGSITASPQPTPRELYIATTGILFWQPAGPGAASGEGAMLGPIAVTAGQRLPWAVSKIGVGTTAQVFLCW